MISSLFPCTESLFGLLRPLDLGPMVRPHCYRRQVSSYSYPKPLFQNETRYQTFQIIFTLSLVLKYTAKQSVFLRIQVRTSSQTKGLERG